jgi:1-acyl-sn-glycerol-3-phosphate acyltransferase
VSQRSLVSQIWYRSVKRILQVLWVLIYGVRPTGMENIPSEGAVLLLSNHQSHLDPPLVGCCCPRRANFLARSGLFDFAPFGWFIRSVGAFPIDIDRTGIGGIKETLRWLKRGEVVLMFPEGSRSHDGRIAPFRPGFAVLAYRSDVTLVPVAVDGAYEAWPRWRRFPGPGRLRVRFGKPLPPEEVRRYEEKDLVREVERRVRECHAELVAAARRPSLADPPARLSE